MSGGVLLYCLNKVTTGIMSSVSSWWIHQWRHLDSQNKKKWKVSKWSDRKDNNQRSSGVQN